MTARRVSFADALPISIASGVVATFGIAMTIMGGHLLLASTVLGSAIGPAPLMVRSIVELFGGVLFATAGIAFAWRRAWALSVIRLGWIPWVAYEVGLLLGRSAERLTFGSGTDTLFAFGVIVALTLAGLCARAPACSAFVANGTSKKR
jgi:hypothetical protein